jgi:hypothetical protein
VRALAHAALAIVERLDAMRDELAGIGEHAAMVAEQVAYFDNGAVPTEDEAAGR